MRLTDVSAPSLIDRIAVELTVNQIRQSSQVVVTVRGSNVFAMVAMEDAVASQKSAQALKTNAQALLAQRKVQAHHSGNLFSATADNGAHMTKQLLVAVMHSVAVVSINL